MIGKVVGLDKVPGTHSSGHPALRARVSPFFRPQDNPAMPHDVRVRTLLPAVNLTPVTTRRLDCLQLVQHRGRRGANIMSMAPVVAYQNIRSSRVLCDQVGAANSPSQHHRRSVETTEDAVGISRTREVLPVHVGDG
jgi:hypothetical protein